MGAPKIVVPPAPVLPPLPDQADIAVQQFGAMFRRRAAAGYESTFPNQPETNGVPLPFRTDTDPAPAAPAPSPGATVREAVADLFPRRRTQPAPAIAPALPEESNIVVDPATGLPTKVPVKKPATTGSRPSSEPTPTPDPEMALRDLIARRFSKIRPR